MKKLIIKYKLNKTELFILQNLSNPVWNFTALSKNLSMIFINYVNKPYCLRNLKLNKNITVAFLKHYKYKHYNKSKKLLHNSLN